MSGVNAEHDLSSDVFKDRDDDDSVGVKRKTRWDTCTVVGDSADPVNTCHVADFENVYPYALTSFESMVDSRIELALAKNLVAARTQSMKPNRMSKVLHSDFHAKRIDKQDISYGKDSFAKLNFAKRFSCYDWTKLDPSRFWQTSLSDILLCNGTKGLGTKSPTEEKQNRKQLAGARSRDEGVRSEAMKRSDLAAHRVFKKDCVVRLPPACHPERCCIVLLPDVFKDKLDLTTVLLRCVAFGEVKHFLVYEKYSAVASFKDLRCAKICATSLKGELFLPNTM